ncbi:MAG: biopolymer transporter ExbB [Leptospiraceae bacterium]|nr:biopolymer transporter ExbB [Leptospiraceae bacterium]
MNELLNLPAWLVPGLIVLASILAAGIIMERAFKLLVQLKPLEEEELSHFQELLQADSYVPAYEFSEARSKSHPGFSQILPALERIESDPTGDSEYEMALELSQHIAARQLKRYLPTLGTISTISPLLGLLGTVTGMIKSFQAFAETNVQSNQLMGGIDEALITTSMGLIVAIPSLIAYNHFVSRANAYFEEANLLSDLLKQTISEKRQKGEQQHAKAIT